MVRGRAGMASAFENPRRFINKRRGRGARYHLATTGEESRLAVVRLA